MMMIPTTHLSDCSIYNEPAFPAGPCDCRVAEIAKLRKRYGRPNKGDDFWIVSDVQDDPDDALDAIRFLLGPNTSEEKEQMPDARDLTDNEWAALADRRRI